MRRAGDPRQGVQPVLQGGCGRSRRPHRLDPGMAKKRVHEIAKQRGMPSKEVIAILQKAGLDVKTAAQSFEKTKLELRSSTVAKAPSRKSKNPRRASRSPR